MQDLPDETAITEITIRPDGRIYVFGMSHEVLSALAAVCPQSDEVRQRLDRLKVGREITPIEEGETRT